MAKLKRRKRTKQSKKIIKTSILKIVVFLLFVGLNWTGLLTVGKTLASFFDNENSNANTFAAGSLNFHLRSDQTNFYPYDTAEDIKPGDSVTRDIYIDNDGTLPFKYKARTEKISGDADFCEVLQLKTWLYTVWPGPSGQNMQLKYDGLLMDLTFPAVEISGYEGQEDRWYFQISLPLGTLEEKYKDKSCSFKFIFDGWQVNFDYLSGFSNTEEISSYLADPSSVVINEFLPIAGDYPEFIEFYNKGDTYLDIANWLIETEDALITINQDILYGEATSTIIESKKWLVIDLSKVGEDILDDADDTITLYDSENNKIDTISYVGANMADKSYARIPDGSPNWIDPVPTPGALNQLSDDEVIEIVETQEFITENIVQEPIRETCEENGANRPCGCEMGVCQIGIQICQDGYWNECIGAVFPSREICDGVDNDCDGETDEGGVCSGGNDFEEAENSQEEENSTTTEAEVAEETQENGTDGGENTTATNSEQIVVEPEEGNDNSVTTDNIAEGEDPETENSGTDEEAEAAEEMAGEESEASDDSLTSIAGETEEGNSASITDGEASESEGIERKDNSGTGEESSDTPQTRDENPEETDGNSSTTDQNTNQEEDLAEDNEDNSDGIMEILEEEPALEEQPTLPETEESEEPGSLEDPEEEESAEEDSGNNDSEKTTSEE